MASRTQLRLSQITGSFGSVANGRLPGSIHDYLSAATSGSIVSADLSGSLSHIASAIKRIHGHDSFSENLAGVFKTPVVVTGSLKVKTNDGDQFSVSADGATVNIGLADSATDKKLVFNHDTVQTVVGIDDSIDGNVGRFVIHTSDDDGSLDSDAPDFSIDTNGNIFIAKSTTITQDLTVNNNLSVTGDTTVAGNLTVSGDIAYNYVTSSVVEFNDPMLVTNAIDTTSNAGLQFTSASFANNSLDIESEAGYDYGVIYKRSLAYSDGNGAGTGNTSVPGEISRQAENVFNSEKDGAPFAVFKTNGVPAWGGSIPADAGANQGDGAKININIQTSPDHRGNGNAVDLLKAMKGSYVILSSSDGGGKARLATIISGSAGDTGTIQFQVLDTTQTYGGLVAGSKQDAMGNSQFAANVGSVHVLNAYAGTIFDKESNVFHMAAGAITGSGDNKFLSGSANILRYGGVAAAKLSIFGNDVISGSQEKLSAVFDNSGTGNELIISSLNSTELVLSGANDLKLVTAGGHVILPNGFAQGNNGDVMTLNSQGEITMVAQSAIAAAGGSTAKGVRIITGSHAAGKSLPVGSGEVTTGDAITGLLVAGTQGTTLDVFVNGQLLISGSAAEVGTASRDYSIAADAVTFAFDLEDQDVVQVIKRPS